MLFWKDIFSIVLFCFTSCNYFFLIFFIFLYVNIKYFASKMSEEMNIPIDKEENKIVDCNYAFNTTKVIK